MSVAYYDLLLQKKKHFVKYYPYQTDIVTLNKGVSGHRKKLQYTKRVRNVENKHEWVRTRKHKLYRNRLADDRTVTDSSTRDWPTGGGMVMPKKNQAEA